MADQQTPKSRARRLIKNHIGTAGHTLEELFVEIAQEIEDAEKRGFVAGYESGDEMSRVD